METQTKQHPTQRQKSNPLNEQIQEHSLIENAALKYLEKGFSIIPINPENKKAYIEWTEFQTRRPTGFEIIEFWTQYPKAMIGVVTGAISGIDVFDTDNQEADDELQSYLPETLLCPMQKTPGGDKHKHSLFAHASGIRNVNDKNNGNFKFHVRGEGGYFIIAPSVNSSGKCYQWLEGLSIDEVTPPPIPERLYKALTNPTEKTNQAQPSEWRKDRLEGSPLGSRNIDLTQLVGSYVARGLLKEEILTLALEANSKSKPPLSIKEVEGVVDSILKTHQRKHPETEKEIKNDVYNLIQGQTLLSMVEQQKQWLWDGVLPAGGLSYLVSKPKVGKSLLCFNMGVIVSRKNGQFLGKDVAHGPVIYLALEENKYAVKKNMETMGGDFSNIYFHFGMAPKNAVPELVKEMERLNPTLVIVDIAQKLIRMTKIEDYAEATTKLEPVMNVAQRLNCHILLTHHAPKSERELIDSVLGSTGLAGSVDTLMVIKKDGRGRRTFFTVQRYHKPEQPDISDWVLNLSEDGITTQLAGVASEVNFDETKEAIFEVLKKIGEGKFYDKPMTVTEIMALLQKGKALTLACLKSLYEENKIKRNGTGKKASPYTYEIK